MKATGGLKSDVACELQSEGFDTSSGLSFWTDPTPVDKFCPHDEASSKASGLTPPR